jgi:hypothetical protein
MEDKRGAGRILKMMFSVAEPQPAALGQIGWYQWIQLVKLV